MRKRSVQSVGTLVLFAFILLTGGASQAADTTTEPSSSMQMLERVEIIVYGEPNRGGLIERLNSVERELFGRDLPGSISERHSAILSFLEEGTETQPSMLFKMAVAEWIVGRTAQERRAIIRRVESMETELDGTMQYGRPLAMRVERLLASLVAEQVTSREVIVPTATVLRAQFLEELRVATAQRGDRVAVALVNDLLVGNVLIAPKGSLIETIITNVRRPRAFGIPSDMQFDFRALLPLGPQRVPLTVGEASRRATGGEGALLGAGAASIGGALLLGPVGLLGGGLIRGNAINIPQGTVVFLETSGDVRVTGYPVPENLRIDPSATIRESLVPTTTTTTTTTVTTTTSVGGGTPPPPSPGVQVERETIVLPEEQRIH